MSVESGDDRVYNIDESKSCPSPYHLHLGALDNAPQLMSCSGNYYVHVLLVIL
jgi:hypothetical protein